MKEKLPEIIDRIRGFKPDNEDVSKISFSQMQTYYGCNYRWYVYYGLGNKISESTIHTLFGTSIHETIQSYLTEVYGKRKPKEEKIVLVDFLLERMIENYTKEIKNEQKGKVSREELEEFYNDGVNILSFFEKKRNAYFSKRGWVLVGNEIPLSVYITPKLKFEGFIDTLMYHQPTGKFLIIDYKTSTSGWSSYAKKDTVKTSQLILYKVMLSNQFGIPLEDIEINYLILRRKVNTGLEFVPKRIQEFSPPSGKVKVKQTVKMLQEFVEDCFTEDGRAIFKDYSKNLDNCKFCPFKDNIILCNRSN